MTQEITTLVSVERWDVGDDQTIIDLLTSFLQLCLRNEDKDNITTCELVRNDEMPVREGCITIAIKETPRFRRGGGEAEQHRLSRAKLVMAAGKERPIGLRIRDEKLLSRLRYEEEYRWIRGRALAARVGFLKKYLGEIDSTVKKDMEYQVNYTLLKIVEKMTEVEASMLQLIRSAILQNTLAILK